MPTHTTSSPWSPASPSAHEVQCGATLAPHLHHSPGCRPSGPRGGPRVSRRHPAPPGTTPTAYCLHLRPLLSPTPFRPSHSILKSAKCTGPVPNQGPPHKWPLSFSPTLEATCSLGPFSTTPANLKQVWVCSALRALHSTWTNS